MKKMHPNSLKNLRVHLENLHRGGIITSGKYLRSTRRCEECGEMKDMAACRRFCSPRCQGKARSKQAMTAYQRVMARVMSKDGCWLVKPWARAKDGYCIVKNESGITVRGTRVVWEHHHGPITGGLSVCHHCDVPSCVNPEHLFLGTQKDNIADMVRKGRHRSQRKNKPVADAAWLHELGIDPL